MFLFFSSLDKNSLRPLNKIQRMVVHAVTMNKQQLNNEIILCRPAVRQAKVIVIRKILKKMKILKSCKKETVKEKKLKKSERLFKKVQLMKKVKNDDVTNFALRNASLEAYLQGPKVCLKENVLAHLAKNKAVSAKVSSIREKFKNWETELPTLLDSLGKKKHSARKRSDIERREKVSENIKDKGSSMVEVNEKSKVSKGKTFVKPNAKTPEKVQERDKQEEKKKVKPLDDNMTRDDSNSCAEEIKISDPFFINKKMILPKLLQENLSLGNSNKERENQIRENGMSAFPKKPFKVKRESVPFGAQKAKTQFSEESLHPSWAAKRVKLILPFEGKKIVFSEE